MVERAVLDVLEKRERNGLRTFLDGYRVWLVRDDFVDSEQSPAILFTGDKAIGALELGSWPDSQFEYYKQVLDVYYKQLLDAKERET